MARLREQSVLSEKEGIGESDTDLLPCESLYNCGAKEEFYEIK